MQTSVFLGCLLQGNYLLTGSSDRSSIGWDTATGTVKQRFGYHEAPTLDVDWKDDKTFATCSTDKAILVQTVSRLPPFSPQVLRHFLSLNVDPALT